MSKSTSEPPRFWGEPTEDPRLTAQLKVWREEFRSAGAPDCEGCGVSEGELHSENCPRWLKDKNE